MPDGSVFDFELQQGRKISEFPGSAVLPDSAVLTFISDGVNFQIPLSDFLASLNVTGVIENVGDGQPIFNASGAVNQIRALQTLTGLSSQQGTSGNVEISDGLITQITSTNQHVMVNDSEIVSFSLDGIGNLELKDSAPSGALIRVFLLSSTTELTITTADSALIVYRGSATGSLNLPAGIRQVTWRKMAANWQQESYDPT